MAEQALATENSIQQLAENIKKGNETQSVDTKGTTEKVVEAVGKGSDRTALVAEKLGKASQLTFDGMKASLGFVGKTKSFALAIQ